MKYIGILLAVLMLVGCDLKYNNIEIINIHFNHLIKFSYLLLIYQIFIIFMLFTSVKILGVSNVDHR